LLSDYQERIVAGRYFQGRKSLQWNNYLFFVVDTEPEQTVKQLVERDRRYARKLVLSEPELDNALTPPTFKVSDAVIKTDILTTWTDILAASNLDRAILNDENMPRKLELIEQYFGQTATANLKSVPTPTTKIQPFLRHVLLEKFRPFPEKRDFDFGTVTLISGVNGSGKTSLLEAIELVYCGQTKRNPKGAGSYLITATYDGGKTERANEKRQGSVYRERNLAWYGQFEQKTTNLYQMFARFNFLDTDAAVGLAEPKSQAALEEDLSKLLVGPDASKTWELIDKTGEKLDEKIKELNGLRNQIDLERGSVERQIAASSDLKQESGAILRKLDGLLLETAWARSQGEVVESVKKLVESLSIYGSIVQEAIKCEWAGAPVTISALKQFLVGGRSRVESSEKALKDLANMSALERRLTQELSQDETDLSIITDFLRFTEAGVGQRLAEADGVATSIATHRRNLLGFSAASMQRHFELAKETTVAMFCKNTSAQIDDVKKLLHEAKQSYSAFSALREESANLAQRLRDVASQILKTASDPDTCPLCHQKYSQGELSKHIHAGVDPRIESRAAELLEAIRKQETSLAELESRQSTALWSETACRRLGKPTSITIPSLLQLVSDSETEIARLSKRQLVLSEELGEFNKAGMTAEKYRQLLANVPPELKSAAIEQIKQRREALERARDEKTSNLRTSKENSQTMLRSTAEMLVAKDASVKSVESALSELKERMVTTESVLNRLESYISALPVVSTQPLSQTALTIETVRRVAGDYQATLSKEQNAVSILAESTKRKEQIEQQLAGLVPRIERFTEAREVLSHIQSEHSLHDAMDDALKQNRTAIEAIFSRIHSPAEFSGLGDNLTTLKRKSGGDASLREISTGQRAAFALSLFLAQNAQLRTAPPLILIDDPIAHVDDLNCLSFLDYLREVIIAGDRQIVFTTANDKLATLFERKFDFLGDEEFKRYNLAR
ncbi:MAG: AAA family ATPase, partial [Cyanobacteria bacterium]|nr:AAA family ATPase [Cyanobacteriota bacterium]